MFTNNYHYIKNFLKHSRSITKQYFTLFNRCSKEIHVNISYANTVNKIDLYMDASISPTSVRYIISVDNQLDKKEENKEESMG